MVNRLIIYSSIFVLICSFSVMANELDELAVEGKNLVNTYSAQLQQEYDKAYATISFDAVRKVCKETALILANDLDRNGWIIRRTSLDPLGETNLPDETEKRILHDLTDQQIESVNKELPPWYKLTETGNLSEFRYIKAFIMEQRCMTCHTETPGKNSALAAYTLKKSVMKNYFPDEISTETRAPLPVFEE